MWSWWKSLTFLLPLLSLAQADASESECGVPNPDSAVDDLVDQTWKILENPLDLPDKTGLINLLNGELWGLSTLNRSGPVYIICNSSTVTLRFTMSATKPVRVRYEWEKKIPSRTMKGVAYARTASLEVFATIEVPRHFPDPEDASSGVPRVAALSTERMGEVEVNLGGLAHVSWLSSRAIAFMTSVFETSVTRAVDDRLKASMNVVLRRAASAERLLLSE